MSLQNMLLALYESDLSLWIRQNPPVFPTLESFHVIAIALVFGTILIVDLRLIGFTAHRRSIDKLITELLPFTWGAFALAVVTGLLMFVANAPAYMNNAQFLWKMVVIAAAGINMMIFHATIYRRIADWDVTIPPPNAARTAGVLSITLWLTVIYLGRWIGFTLETFF
ncbi:DUF6644 family protein [Niveispirillum sp. BGYR6]|uniref:DUF6644 family protein n=1 Tax=Niveispirillum sp. BGYR6 TaxID=2971249 RepID=UPI0022B975AA|nr:DUF6644 family protein [Niveispirillum sp. BGYR6]MDG5493859.1 hypothetical protein [Niveispirillum sp. BGYR6]